MKKMNKTNIFYILLGIIFISVVCVKVYNPEGFKKSIGKKTKNIRKKATDISKKVTDPSIGTHMKDYHTKKQNQEYLKKK